MHNPHLLAVPLCLTVKRFVSHEKHLTAIECLATLKLSLVTARISFVMNPLASPPRLHVSLTFPGTPLRAIAPILDQTKISRGGRSSLFWFLSWL